MDSCECGKWRREIRPYAEWWSGPETGVDEGYCLNCNCRLDSDGTVTPMVDDACLQRLYDAVMAEGLHAFPKAFHVIAERVKAGLSTGRDKQEGRA